MPGTCKAWSHTTQTHSHIARKVDPLVLCTRQGNHGPLPPALTSTHFPYFLPLPCRPSSSRPPKTPKEAPSTGEKQVYQGLMGEGEKERRRVGLGAGRGPSGPGSQKEPGEPVCCPQRWLCPNSGRADTQLPGKPSIWLLSS